MLLRCRNLKKTLEQEEDSWRTRSAKKMEVQNSVGKGYLVNLICNCSKKNYSE